MSPEQIIAFALFALVAAVTPGPSNLILMSMGANVGAVRGLPALFGVVAGMGAMMFLAAFGLGQLLIDRPNLLLALKWIGGAFLLWLAWKIASAGPSRPAKDRRVLGFWGAAAFQWVNPKSWLVSVGAVTVYLAAGAEEVLTQAIYFGVVFALAALPSCFVWLAFGAALQRVLSSDKAVRIFNVSMGLVLGGSVIMFVS